MPGVITDPTAALLALVNQGALNAYAEREDLYWGRYAFQQLVSATAVQQLIELGHAEGASDGVAPVVYPTLLGLKVAARAQEPPSEEVGEVSAVLGSRIWERAATVTTPTVGLFLSQSQVSSLLRALVSARSKASATAGTLILATGGLVPPQLAVQLEGAVLPDPGMLEVMSVPTKLRGQLSSLRRFRFVISVEKGDGPLLIFMAAGPNLRFLGRISLTSLLGVLADVHPTITDDDSYVALGASYGASDKRLADATGKSVS